MRMMLRRWNRVPPQWLLKTAPFMVTLKEAAYNPFNSKIAHALIVDGLNDAGELMIRDPAKPSRYEMTMADFIANWTGHAVYREDISR